MNRVEIARGDALKGDDDLRCGEAGVHRHMRHRGVAAFALHPDRIFVGGRQQRARADCECADRQTRHVVHSVDLFDAKPLHHAVVDHRLAPRAAFLRGLEDDGDGPGEVSRLGHVLRGAEQHGGVPVMAAGVHDAGGLGGVFGAGLLLDWQGVHIGAHAHGPARRLAPDDPDDAGAPNPFDNLVAAEGAEFFSDDPGGADRVVHQLRVLMQIASPCGDLVMHSGDGVDDRH